MSYNVNNIIQINVRISPQGLSFANFATAVLFAPESELAGATGTFAVDTYREYTSPTALAVDFPTSTGPKTKEAGDKWLGGIPASNKLIVWGTADADADWTTTLDKARNVLWWYWTFVTDTVYADIAIAEEIAAWSDINESYFMNCQTGTEATDEIRDPAETNDIATILTTNGVRHASTFAHATDAYAGIALCKWFAAVNYAAARTTITGEFKKLSGVSAEDISDTAYGAMTQDTKKCQFYSVVELQGSTDNGRVINSWSHSANGEWMDDIVNLDAFINGIKVALYNAIANPPTKLGQDPGGQSVLIGAAKTVCEQYVSNDYLGPRNYIDPDDGVEKFTVGYEILTKPEDILDLSDSDRDLRFSAALRVRIFRKGAIQKAVVDIDVF